MLDEKKEKGQTKQEILDGIEGNAHHPTWEELCELFPDKYKMEDKPEEYEPDKNLYVFEYGNKAIQILLTPPPQDMDVPTEMDKIFVMSHIQNQPDKKKMDGQTTLLYEAIKNKLKKILIIEQKPIKYVLDTYNHDMAMWAITEGEKIFEWEKTTVRIRRKGEEKVVVITKEELQKMTDEERRQSELRVTCTVELSS